MHGPELNKNAEKSGKDFFDFQILLLTKICLKFSVGRLTNVHLSRYRLD